MSPCGACTWTGASTVAWTLVAPKLLSRLTSVDVIEPSALMPGAWLCWSARLGPG